MIDWYPLVVASAPVGLTFNVLLNVVVATASNGRTGLALLSGAVAGFLATACATIAGLYHLEADAWDNVAFLLFNISTYLALAYGYLNFVNLNIASLRIRLLSEYLAAQKPLSRDDILAMYSPKEMINRRITRLTEQGHIIVRDGRCYRGRRILLLIAYTIDTLKWIVLGRMNRIIARFKDHSS